MMNSDNVDFQLTAIPTEIQVASEEPTTGDSTASFPVGITTTTDNQAITSSSTTTTSEKHVTTVEEKLPLKKKTGQEIKLGKKILVCSNCFRKYQRQKPFDRHVNNCSSSSKRRKISKKDEIGKFYLL